MNSVDSLSKLKFGFITTNLKSGGAEKAIIKLAGALAQRGHNVHLILLEHITEHQPPAGVTVHSLTLPGVTISKGSLGKRIAAFKLKRLHSKLAHTRPFDTLISTLPFCDEVVKLAALPQVWFRIANTLSSEIEKLLENNSSKAHRRFKRYQRLYDGEQLIAVAEGVADDLRDQLKLQQATISTIHNYFDFAAIRQKATLPDKEIPKTPYVIHVGRFNSQKRHDLLFSAWCKLQSPHKLVLLTKESKALSQMIELFGLTDQVIVAGFKSNPYPWIKQAERLVLCSDHEGLPNVLIEALILGTQVISTDCPSGAQEILMDHLCSSLIPMNDVHALVHALRTPPQRYLTLPDGFSEKFSSMAVIHQYENLTRLQRRIY
ncbi:hypothetical protein MNBD_GAMMA16-50 [hydrothermal vent metagenome]|uniref:Glycosyltransferase subfamily 4-like N-terminal domain-containing protein n=1 Tax=hydrothermal vent metagenome TaxID=652676 RepID=A0A3B0ZXT7_9ZZZZ